MVTPPVTAADLSPNITIFQNTMHSTTQFKVTITISELLGTPTNGSEMLVRIPKDPIVSFTFNQAATQIGVADK